MGGEVKVLSDRVDAISRDLDRVKVKHLEHQDDNIATETRKLKRSDGKVSFPREKPGVEDGEKRNLVKLISKTCVAEFILPDSGLRRFRNLAFRLKNKMRVTGAGVMREMVAEVMKLKVEGSGVLNMKQMDEYSRTPRSTFELHETSLVWNFKHADIKFGRLQANDMLQHLWTRPISNASMEVTQGGQSVEVQRKERKQYNGKTLGSGYTGGKSNSSISFMFHNFPDSWGMGNLWMIFKKYGMVFDMFMVQKRLRNGHKYGFVRFKNIEDMELLHQRLRRIQIGNEYLRVYVAYDRRDKTTNYTNGGQWNTKDNGKFRSTKEFNHNRNQSNMFGQNRNFGMRDDRRYNEVLSGSKQHVKKEGKRADEKEYDSEDKAHNNGTRVIEVGDDGTECDLLGRNIVDEVKEIEYLEKLSQICEEEVCFNVEVKYMGGLEVIIVFETLKTATNILEDLDHGLRRWIHKL
ncbi:hypothetical protein CTI12_AA082190 [Artemisia annua]|uniref:RRM domain-containing protein n=1 Tax=Artemisia annua TaxID=35608 RepID=A0A2U1Q2E9_ARTAN|nr:hypothetical protein CTI12_AA082190 [Artemisia annua]